MYVYEYLNGPYITGHSGTYCHVATKSSSGMYVGEDFQISNLVVVAVRVQHYAPTPCCRHGAFFLGVVRGTREKRGESEERGPAAVEIVWSIFKKCFPWQGFRFFPTGVIPENPLPYFLFRALRHRPTSSSYVHGEYSGH